MDENLSDGSQLEAAIFANPEDDTARVAYADWLEGSGQSERAVFIRIQERLARADADDPTIPDLRKRERELLLEHGAEWAVQYEDYVRQQPPKRPKGELIMVTFERGIPMEVYWQDAPTVSNISNIFFCSTGKNKAGERIACSTRESDTAIQNFLTALATTEPYQHLRNSLRYLDFSQYHIGDEGFLMPICRGQPLSQLADMHIGNLAFGCSADIIFPSRCFPALRHLRVNENEMESFLDNIRMKKLNRLTSEAAVQRGVLAATLETINGDSNWRVWPRPKPKVEDTIVSGHGADTLGVS